MLASVLSFLLKNVQDERLLTSHISLLTAICLVGNHTKAGDEFSVSRSKLMKLSGIKGKGTYHRILSQLIEFGFIHYQSSYHPSLGSTISLIN
ncbi:MAG: hypothetical protein EOP48_17630 [Sphingobacteriales bacterium]|nr:MAG: hypothetical protein EOP48_17630 [Sphingobacteriales bacterium]